MPALRPETALEHRLLVAASAGEWADATAIAEGGREGPENAKIVRGDFLRSVVTGEQGAVRAVMLRGARITGALDLRGDVLACAMRCDDCTLHEEVVLADAVAPTVAFAGCELPGLDGRHLRSSGRLELTDCVLTSSPLILLGARIDGDVDLRRSRLMGAPVSMACDDLRMTGNTLAASLRCHGRVSAIGIQVDGTLDLEGAHVGGEVLLDRAKVRGGVYLRRLRADGEVRLAAAHLGRQIDLSGADLRAEGRALFADSASVEGDWLMGGGLRAEGPMVMRQVHIGGRLSLHEAQMATVDLEGAQVEADLLCTATRVRGALRLLGARVGGQVVLNASHVMADGGRAIVGDGLTAQRGLVADDGFVAEGQVRLCWTRIDGQVSFKGARLHAPEPTCLTFDNATIGADLFLAGLSAQGQVSMVGIRVSRDVVLTDATLRGRPMSLRADGARVEGNLFLRGKSRTHGSIRFYGLRLGGVLDLRSTQVGADDSHAQLTLDDSKIGGDVLLRSAQVAGAFSTQQTSLEGLIDLVGLDVGGRQPVSLAGAVLTNCRVQADGELRLERVSVRGPTTVRPSADGRLILSALSEATLEAPLAISDGVDIGRCQLRNVTGLEQLLLQGADPGWPRIRRRRALADELLLRHEGAGGDGRATARAIESSYRQLRGALEDAKAAPAAADFYFGEMEMRRMAADRWSMERMLLFAYKLTSGYGLRAWRALSSYVAVVLGMSVALHLFTRVFIADPMAATGTVRAGGGLNLDHFGDTVAFVARSSVTLAGPPVAGLTAWGTVLIMVARLAAPLFIALALLALRARARR